jgi:ribosomal protein L31
MQNFKYSGGAKDYISLDIDIKSTKNKHEKYLSLNLEKHCHSVFCGSSHTHDQKKQ